MPGVDVSIDGAPQWNTTDYSVDEAATPIDVTSSAGGSPTFSMGTNLLPGDKAIIGKPIVIRDGANGEIQGKISGLDSGDTGLKISGFTSFSLLNTVVVAKPFSGTLSAAIGYYLGLVGFTSSNYQVDASIASRSIVNPGFNANLQDFFKNFCAAQQVELSFVDGSFICRPIRVNVAQVYRDSQSTFSLNLSEQAQRLDILYYNSVWKINTLAYPLTQPDQGSDIQQVSDGQTITVNLRLTPTSADGTGVGASLSSIAQPSPSDSVPESISNFSGIASQYSIIDSNNNPYPAAWWVDRGGSITVSIDESSDSITATITGPSDSLGPYRIAGVSSDGSSYYSSLRLVGTGTFYNKKLYSVPTGLTSLDTNTVSAPTVDNPSINTYQDAVTAGLTALRKYVGPTQSISVKTAGINTNGKSGEYTLLTFGGWDALFGGITFSTWDASWAGKTFQQYDDYLFSLVRGKFANQAFGNIGGARIFDDNCWYRISSATITESSITYSADADNTFLDWDRVWGGKTFADWDAAWGGKRFMDNTPYLMSSGNNAQDDYFMSSSQQDFTKLPGLGYEHFPNDPSFKARGYSVGFGIGGYGVSLYGL